MIYLNAWNARVPDALTEYIEDRAPETEIFCFQEAYDDMKKLCARLLPNYVAYDDYKFVTEDDDFPQVTYVRDDIPVLSSGSILKDQPNCGLGLFVEVQPEGAKESTFVCNFHGMSRPVDKLDDPNRLTQSRTLIDFFKGKDRAIIGGDFNISPNTESIAMFEEAGYTDLIKKHGIETTRNHLIWDLYPDSKQYFSDYIFVAPGIDVRRFAVPDDEISDHLALELSIS